MPRRAHVPFLIALEQVGGRTAVERAGTFADARPRAKAQPRTLGGIAEQKAHRTVHVQVADVD